ncbi:MAG: PTS IIA-like nitrogen-regulatory protein PtsN [Alphaproteobacteria bacterium]|nr:MAG: PTS IIA-like nitrogen-regulatory protein PtsN [Alphaproteobacteria bacterium]
MDVSDLITPKAVVVDLCVGSKKQALQELAARASSLTAVDERLIFDTLLDRERLGSTGVGQGIALPHGRFEQVKEIFGLFARLSKPVDFESVDEKPVDLIFVLLVPETAGANHLKALARISRLLRTKTLCTKLRGARDPDAVYALLCETTDAPAGQDSRRHQSKVS